MRRFFGQSVLDTYNKLGNKLEFRVLKVINNETLKKSYFYRTNYHFDHGLSNDGTFYTVPVSEKELKRLIKEVRLWCNRKKPRLIGVDNDPNYTRLIYSLDYEE